MNFYTIGVYGSTQEQYFTKLTDAKIDLFCDIRQRRGVRGKKYSFVNSKRLQQSLNDLDIKYMHIKDLAPTKEIRDKQKYDDLETKTLKRDRDTLGNKFIFEYKKCIIDSFCFDDLMQYFKDKDYQNIVFFCVEEKAKACHRSLVASKIEQFYQQEIKDL